MADVLIEAGASVEVLDASDARGVALARFDRIIVAASVHLGHFHVGVADFAERHRHALEEKQAPFVAVSLSAASDDKEDIEGIRACVDTFVRQTGWHPAHVEHVAGAFRFSRLDFFKSWALRHIAAKKGIDIEPGQDLELTDWPKLRSFVEEFLRGA